VPRRLRAPSFLLLQDLWPDSVTESGFVAGPLGRGMDTALHHFCDWTYRRSTGIGVISPSMAGILTGRGVEPAKIRLIPNWVEDSHLLPHEMATDALRQSLGLPPGRLFMYAGNFGELQGLEILIDAFAQCPEVNLALVGGGVALARLQQQVSSRAITNVHFVPSQPTARIGHFIAASDVQIVSLRDTPLLRATMPSKVQSSMAASRPILACAAGDVADLVTTSHTGVAARPGDLSGTVTAIRSLDGMRDAALLEMGRRARLHYEAHFAPEAGLDRLESWLAGENILDNRQTAGER
jgi:colanic acid biosynthesis glycosyl transferase WcaI